MSFRGRRLRPGTWLLATLAILALTAVGPASALAAGPADPPPIAPSILRPDPLPVPREMQPGGVSGFRLPFAAGQVLRIEQGWNSKFSHNGIWAYSYDIGMPLNTDVLAAAAGLVAFVHDGETACGGPELLNKANAVTIYHADGSATLYAHLGSVSVKVGQIVATGQVIGKSGDTGYSQCVPHLHFARQYQGKGVAQSVPMYFQGYEKRELHNGDLLSVPAAPCTPPSATVDPVVNPDLGSFCGEYHGGTLDQPVAFVRRDGFLNFDWGSNGPGGYWLDDASSAYSARWSGDFVFPPSVGLYTIGVMWSGAVLVSIDGVPVVDRWGDQAAGEVLLSRALGAGIHRIDVQYMTTSGHGMLKLGWGRLVDDE